MPLNTHIPERKRKRFMTDVLLAAFVLAALLTLSLALRTSGAAAEDANPANSGGAAYQATPATVPGMRAKLSDDGRTALAPEGAPQEIKEAIAAANRLVRKPYIYGGGHATFKRLSRGYDCSSTVSWALGNAGLLKGTPLDSSSFMRWGKGGRGNWVTVYTNPGHAYAYIAGLRLDTSGPGERGPRWRKAKRSNRGFRARHPQGF
jgi:hypothetical protein